uniref:Disease resistance R13L4/SHOC-2-like LRR domain-containing protein n=1 Tax=Leersia perrieri TaxID=77586 RepID=A0A0D9XTM3_9ORYZ
MLSCPFSTVPGWIAQLSQLTTLELCLVKTPTDSAIEVLTRLHGLIHLFLHVMTVLDRNIIFCGTAFPVLTCFGFMSSAPCLTFKQGALPKLQKLDIFTGVYNAIDAGQYGKMLVGIEHLQSLEQVTVNINCWYLGESEVEKAEDALRSAIKINPRDLNIQIKQFIPSGKLTTNCRGIDMDNFV